LVGATPSPTSRVLYDPTKNRARDQQCHFDQIESLFYLNLCANYILKLEYSFNYIYLSISPITLPITSYNCWADRWMPRGYDICKEERSLVNRQSAFRVSGTGAMPRLNYILILCRDTPYSSCKSSKLLLQQHILSCRVQHETRQGLQGRDTAARGSSIRI
jgi:hypothetical protein